MCCLENIVVQENIHEILYLSTKNIILIYIITMHNNNTKNKEIYNIKKKPSLKLLVV